MKIKGLLAAICFLLAADLFAQGLTQNIRGIIIDRESEMPLIGATIQIVDSDPLIGNSTNLEGEFVLKDVPVGRHTLKVNFLGYEQLMLPNVLVGSAKEVILNLRMQESFVQMKEVVVTAKNPKERPNNEMATVSSRSFSTDETSRFAASVDDPARMALSFAGVNTTNDISNEIVVRGNSPLGLLWRMNGIEIPSPNHFTEAGASGGGISALSINMLDNSDFFTGAFPAEYGNATSGVFDVKLRNGNNQKSEYAFQLGVLGTDVALEGPFKKGYNGSYLINYRYSTLSVLTGLGIIDTEGDDNIFQDLSFQFNLPTKKSGIFKVFGLIGISSSIGIENRDSVKARPFEEFYDDDFKSNVGILGLSHKYFINDKSFIQTTFAGSRQEIGYTQELINNLTLNKTLSYQDEFVNDAFRLSSYFNKKYNSRNTVRAGFILSELRYDLFGLGNDDDEVFRKFLEDDGRANTVQTYAQWKHRLDKNWTLNSGLHFFHFGLNSSSSIEPRLGLSYKINEVQELSFGFGMHSKIAPLSLYAATTIDENGFESQGNKDLGLTKALHYIIGYDRQLSEQVHFKMEAYYQQLFNVYAVDDENSFSSVNATTAYNTRILSDQATAYNIGTEVTLEKFFSKNFYYLFTASIFDSKYKMPDGREFDTRFNAGYIFTLLGGKEYKVGENKKNLIGVNLKVLWSGGNRYRPIDIQASTFADETVRINTTGFSEIAPDYYRLDATFNYRINNEKVAHIISLQMQNATNRLNVFSYYYDSDENRVLPENQFGIIPVLKYRLEF